MSKKELLNAKRILIVDDESDVLEALEDLLPMCDVVKATRFDEAKEKLESQYFDLAILDIMGVNGFELLEIARRRDILAVMLTAHGLSPETTIKAYKEGAAYLVPKEKMSNIVTYLTDVLEAKEQGKHFWSRWLDRFASYYDRRFSSDWQKGDIEFWKQMRE